MNNTAKKLSPKEVVNQFTEIPKGDELLRAFLMTNTTDISKAAEIIQKWANKSAGNEKAKYDKALTMLSSIMLKRVEFTAILFGIEDSFNTIIDTTATEVKAEETEPEAKVIVMLPTQETIFERVKIAMLDKKAKNPVSGAFKIMNNTFGQGKVLGADGKPAKWDSKQISEYIQSLVKSEVKTEETSTTPVVKEKQDTTQQQSSFGFKTIYNHFMELVTNGKTVDEIKADLKTLLIGKHIKETDSEYVIADETKYEDYWQRILVNLVTSAVKSKAVHDELKEKTQEVETTIEKEVIPFLKKEDADETKVSIAPAARSLRSAYLKSGLNLALMDALDKVKELAAKHAPNLLARNSKEVPKTEKPTVEKVEKVETPAVEIYNDSHNIKESNKELWKEVENFDKLNQIFNKAVELVNKGNWRDALNMCILLITNPIPKVKETDNSQVYLKWNVDQVKQWFNTNVMPMKGKTIEVTKATEEHKVAGPVPVVGTIAKERAVRLLTDSSTWKDKYGFSTFEIPTDNNEGSMLVQVVNATVEQEANLIYTLPNLTKYINGLKDKLVENQNNFPKVKDEIAKTLTSIYSLTSADVKRIVGGLNREASEIRRQIKNDKKYESLLKKRETEKEAQTTENPQNQPAQKDQAVETKNESASAQADITAIEKSVTDEPSNSNKGEDEYDGFYEILKAGNKINYQKEIYEKIKSYPTTEEGIKAVFEVVEKARKDKHFKKNQIGSYKMVPKDDLLRAIQKIYSLGVESEKNK